MNKFFYTLALMICTQIAFAQSSRAISQEVSHAKTIGGATQVSDLFQTIAAPANRSTDQVVPDEAAYFACKPDALAQLRNQSIAYLELAIPAPDGGLLTLELVPSWPYSADFLVETASDGVKTTAYDLGKHFRGTVKGDPSSIVAISVYEQEVMGVIATDGQHYNLGKIANDPQATHVLYKEADFKINQNYECQTDDILHVMAEEAGVAERALSHPVDVYIETDQSVFLNKGSVANVVSYMGALMNQVGLLYRNDSMVLSMSYLYVWDVVDPYPGPTSSNYLEQFRAAKNGVFNGDLAHLVALTPNLGGIAYVNVPCIKTYGVGFSGIEASYNNIPTYSWSVNCIAHELGHNLGSKHTHACAWNGNNTPIDGCGAQAGYTEGCTGAVPVSGTIMSYCHLLQGVGINFANGFGLQPGNLIRNNIAASSCLVPTGGGTPPAGCTHTAINTNTFETDWGIWVDGGLDCIRAIGATTATDGSYSVRLRDNTSSSSMTTNNLNLSAYNEVKVSFGYLASFYEVGEDFWLQTSTNGGTTWTTRADLNCGTEFGNGVKKTYTATFGGPFSSATRFRFQADASDDDDVVYIDNVVITGCRPTGAPPILKNEVEEQFVQEEPIVIAPNPASGVAYISAVVNQAPTQRLQVMRADGVSMLERQIVSKTGQISEEIDLSNFRAGMYIVRLAGADGIKTAKLVVL
jgi:Metallo-peptidase family M12/Secretion system C-terminal sorting domain